jgi:hypothetical protein
MKLVERGERGSPRPYRTRKLDRDAFPGFHPGLFSCLPSGKGADTSPFWATDGANYGNKDCSCDWRVVRISV